MFSSFLPFFFLLGILSILLSLFPLQQSKWFSSFCFLLICFSFSFFCFSFSFFSFIFYHLQENFSLQTIFQSTHSLQPIFYRISSVWGSHSGSMILWTWILSFLSFFFLYTLPYSLRKDSFYLRVAKIQSLILLFFSSYTYFTSSPFLTFDQTTFQGTELNPVLQDIVLAIHPPLIYVGYLTTSLLASHSISLLWSQYTNPHLFHSTTVLKSSHDFIWYARISWICLTCGILLGSWWAYYELGWGGFWFWDPVENASLLPWILLTALLHKPSCHLTILLSFFSFYSCVLATFFVRSGLLDSVHSFAADQQRGLWILCFLILSLLLFLILFYLSFTTFHFFLNDTASQITSHQDSHNNSFSKLPSSLLKKSNITPITWWNQLFFLWIFLVVLIGTFYPTLHQLIFQQGITLGPSFFHSMIFPLLTPMLFLMILSTKLQSLSLITWSKILILISFQLGFLIGSFLFCSFVFTISYDYFTSSLFFTYLASCAILQLIPAIWSYFCHQSPFRSISFLFSHFGVALAVLGLSLWNHLADQKHLIMFPGDSYFFEGIQWVFREVNFLKGPNYDSFYGNFALFKKDSLCAVLFPEKRHYLIQDTYSTKVDIHSHWFSDLHTILGDGNLYTGWSVHFYYYPFLSFLWIAGFFLIAGVLFQLYKEKK